MGDPYEDLGVPYGSDPETVKGAFSRLSRRLTPERRAADPEAAEAYAKIAAAYAELSKRKALVDPFEEWGKGGPAPKGPPPRVPAPAPAAPDVRVSCEGSPETRPSEAYTFHRFKGRFCVAAGAVMAVRGAIGVYLDPGGIVNRLARHVPVIGDFEGDGLFILMIIGIATAVWGGGSFLISEREAQELARRRRRRFF